MAKIMGHRGAPADEPENTLRSFRRALAVGVAALETRCPADQRRPPGGNP